MPKTTLADRIAGVLNTAPKTLDPEEDDVNFTKAELLKGESDSEDGKDFEEEVVSKFRVANTDLLSDVDARYAGKKASRRSLRDSDEETEDEDDSMDDSSNLKNYIASEDEEDEDEIEDENKNDLSEEGDSLSAEDNNESVGDLDENGSSNEYDDASSNENEDGSSNENEDGSLDEAEDGSDEAEDGSDEDGDVTSKEDIKHMLDMNQSKEVNKGICVKHQLSKWESLLEMRIKLQKCLVASNKMPQMEKYREIKKQSGPEFTKKVADAKKNLTNVLGKLIELQELVIKRYPETRNLYSEVSNVKNEGSDEEIPSDTEDEMSISGKDGDEELEAEVVPKKKRKFGDFEADISQQFDKYKDYRNKVIQNWNERTSIGSKSNTPSHSVLNQIAAILSDKPRLIKRTQCKRSNYEIVGQEEKETDEMVSVTNEKICEKVYNSNIFDDDDFYHQLLRELIEYRSADLTDPVQLGRQWIQLQSMRKKMKRNIDTRATKGRKIRYAVHSKLVNTMAPMEKVTLPEEAVNEIYASFFGKKQIAA